MKLIDRTGNKYGKLLVISRVENKNHKSFWLCRCSCGTILSVSGSNLQSGQISCGCEIGKANIVDLTGKKFGKLKVIKDSNKRKRHSGQSKVLWECLCDCGRTKLISTGALTSGKTTSCGCVQNEIRHKEFGQAAFRAIIASYKAKAKQRNLVFDLDDNLFKEMIEKNCYYCGQAPYSKFKRKWKNKTYYYNGVDRVDNNIGYTMNNVVTCCKICNYMKRTLSKCEFIEHITKIFNNKENLK